MNCLNCENALTAEDEYCSACGAVIVRERLTTKKIWRDLTKDAFGWDNKYFRTVRNLVLRPEKLLHDYLSGVRKRYTPPFVFFTIGTALALLIFNILVEDFIAMSNEITKEQIEIMERWMSPELTGGDSENFAREQIETNERSQRYIIRYFNLISFLILPFYALLSYWTFRKRNNYGEHLVINAYLQGFLFLVTIITFIASVLVNPQIYFYVLAFSFLYYAYVFKRLYKLDFGALLLKLLRFIAVLIVACILVTLILMLIGILAALIVAWLKK
jgi:hypothetical protein